MKKRTKAIITVLNMILLSLALSACGGDSEQEEHVMQAMYIPYGEDSFVFIEEENGTVFTATIPEELYDINGKQITGAQLKKGNIVKITGNGVMAESYPGQYHGVSRMDIVEEGQPSDADQYQHIIDGIYQEPDPSLPPTASAEYTTELAIANVYLSEGGYSWSYEDENGETQSVVADSAHILTWRDLIDINLDSPTDLTLQFSEAPGEVKAERWDISLWKKEGIEADIPEGETVKTESKDESWVIPNADKGYVYRITASWENGKREFGFRIP
ncbi:hypothetical protein MCG98_11500 [Ruminococcus sp. OA3]|uniref:hypothetical protein n=1 Tax=Ruminococcus sp. OA3 TaxID=2914164 RepID=UPI001F05B897|nr:hypothetical protein [Ruminococcus sp. OA3]MCH1983191.1 hypothetical protein [Ruminococcus sp. OA3]